MNREIIRDEIKWLMEAINEQYETIMGHGEKIPKIEFDILMDNVRKFYENMHLLKKLNDQAPLTGQKVQAAEERPAPAHPVGDSHDATGIQASGPDHKPAPPSPGVTVTFSDPEPAAEAPAVAEEPPVSTSGTGTLHFRPQGPSGGRQDTSHAAKKAAANPEIDLFASEEPVFSIKLKEAREKTLGPKIPSERIDNLKTAININEKFMFINELFEGNLREYNETIETLNGFKTIDQAGDFLDLMRKKNFWNTGSNAFKKLKDLVERRF